MPVSTPVTCTQALISFSALSNHLRGYIKGDHSNEARQSDGVLYRGIRLSQMSIDRAITVNEARLWARLTPGKRKTLRNLLRFSSFSSKLDALLPLEGLWNEDFLGVIPRVRALHCDEVIICTSFGICAIDFVQEIDRYLEHCARIWTRIHDNREEYMSAIDVRTVSNLEGLYPAVAEADNRRIERALEKGEIFARLVSPQAKADILTNIRQVDEMIPSFRTFKSDTHYLGLLQAVLSKLVSVGRGMTLQTSFRNIFEGSMADFFPAYRQLWLFAMRHWPQILERAPRRGHSRYGSRYVVRQDDEYIAHLASFAIRSGFRSVHLETLAASVNGELEDEERSEIPRVRKAHERYGIPMIHHVDADRTHLFPDAMQEPVSLHPELTSLDVRKQFFHAFFGTEGEDQWDVENSDQAVPHHEMEVLRPRNVRLAGRTRASLTLPSISTTRLEQAYAALTRLQNEQPRQYETRTLCQVFPPRRSTRVYTPHPTTTSIARVLCRLKLPCSQVAPRVLCWV